MAAIHGDLRAAADLICQPLVLEVLVGAESGLPLCGVAPPDADAEQLRAAIRRLTVIGAVHPPPGGIGPDEALTLTARGAELLRLLRELDDAPG